MDVYGIWSAGRKRWYSGDFEFARGLFTQHRGIAAAVLYSWRVESTSQDEWEGYDFQVCAPGEDGLPLLHPKDD